MCGIAGYLNLNQQPAAMAVARSMGDIIAHRGPDGRGEFLEGALAFAHRRLSIIDLSDGGAQPMHSGCGRYVLTYNGEIYNFKELRQELEGRGHRFRSQSDSEVLLEAWAHWGADCLPRLNGMFAFAIWDREERRLHLARDRYGVKPLYIDANDRRILFASEIKAFLPHPDFKAGLDRPGLLEYFTFQNMFSDRTLFDGVAMLPAGCYQSFDANGASEGPRRYWDYHFDEPTEERSHSDYVAELESLLRKAVERQLVSDVDVGSYLSGGMDSGTITAIAANRIDNLRTFTIGFDMDSVSGLELAMDERATAEQMSHLCRTEHYEMVLKAGDMERCMEPLIWHLEDLRAGQCYPNYYAAHLASKFGKVVLTGTGGDEIFAGYPWRYYRAVVNSDFENYIDKYYAYWQRLIPNTLVRKVLAPIWDDVETVWTRDIFRDVFKEHAEHLTQPEDYINHSLYFESKTFLHGLLAVEDKLSMAHGLESRVPMLDNELVDFASRVPVRYKLGNLAEVVRLNENEPGRKTRRYFDKTQDGKLLLRDAMQRYVPTSITEGIKQGFSAPDATWFRVQSLDYVDGLLRSPNARIYDFMDRRTVLSLVDEHLSGDVNRRLLIWSLLCFEVWCGKFLPSDSGQAAALSQGGQA